MMTHAYIRTRARRQIRGIELNVMLLYGSQAYPYFAPRSPLRAAWRCGARRRVAKGLQGGSENPGSQFQVAAETSEFPFCIAQQTMSRTTCT